MAAEDIGAIYNTKIPSLADAADIQEAIKLYHYGSLTYNPNNENTELLQNPSIAYHLNQIQEQVDTFVDTGFGSDYVSVEPTSPDDGFIWMDASSSTGVDEIYSTAIYSDDPPTTNLVNGIIWVDKDSTSKDVYIWNSSTSDWDKASQSLGSGDADEILSIMGVY